MMNIHASLCFPGFSLKPDAKRKRFHPRQEILDEVLSGFLWMALDLPDDASLQEIDAVARRIALQIKSGASPAVIEDEIMALQSRHFCRPGNGEVIRAAARRCMQSVKGA